MGIIFSPDEIAWIESHPELIEGCDTDIYTLHKIHRELVCDPRHITGFNVKLSVCILYLKNKLDHFTITAPQGRGYSKFKCQIGEGKDQAYTLVSFYAIDEDTPQKVKARIIQELIKKSWVNNGILDILREIVEKTGVIWNG